MASIYQDGGNQLQYLDPDVLAYLTHYKHHYGEDNIIYCLLLRI